MVLTTAQRARRKLTTWSRFLLSLLYLGQMLLSGAGRGEEHDRAKRKLMLPDAALQSPPVRTHKDAGSRKGAENGSQSKGGRCPFEHFVSRFISISSCFHSTMSSEDIKRKIKKWT